jgi:hypothetical protein
MIKYVQQISDKLHIPRRQPMSTPINISKNNQLLYEASNIQEAAGYLLIISI